MTTDQGRTWDDETVAELRRLWDLGLSAAKIAQALGFESRNVVCGKAHRLGLSKGRSSPVAVTPAPAPPARRRATPPQEPVEAPAPPGAGQGCSRAAPSGAPVPIEPIAPSPRVQEEDTAAPLTALFDLRPDSCRWPVGDPVKPGFGFCGRASGAGPYCVSHAALAYEPQRPRVPRSLTR